MKVLQINSVCGIRSTGRICTDIADILNHNGDDCVVAYGRETAPEKYSNISVRIGNDFNVKWHVIMSRIFDNTGFSSKIATKKFLRWIDEYNPDIIHLHNLHGYYINIDLLFKYIKRKNTPVIWTFHDCWPFTGHCAYFDFIDCKKWKNEGCNTCPKKQGYPSCYLFDRSKNNFFKKKHIFSNVNNLTIVTPSNWLADLVKCSFLKDYNIQVIPNGIDLSVFKPTDNNFRNKYSLQNKHIFLGVASFWDTRKGFPDFIRMSEMLDDNEVIVMIGLSQQQISDLPKGIIGIPRTNSTKELADIYSSADVFLNPTYEDNYPTVNLEAQGCQTPVVTYKTGGSIESVPIEHIVEKGDVEALLDKSRQVLNSPIILDSKKFSKNNCYTEYIKLYKQMIL